MERLTMRNDKGVAFWRDKRCAGGGYRLTENRKDQEHLDRLAAYEDAMPLERAKELAQAEKDGRLMVLPVKEGAKIYRVRLNFDENCYEIIEKDFDLGLFRPEDFGRMIFRTREEAEEAMKKREAEEK